MAYNTLDNQSNLDLQTLLNYPSINTPLFYPVMLFVFFFVFTSLSFFREVRREGKANIMSSLAVGGYVTTAVAGLLSLLRLISIDIVITTMVISLVFQAIYMFTKNK